MTQLKEISENDLDSLIKEKKIVVVDFSATWCGPCKSLHRILESKVVPKYENDPDVAIVGIDIDQNRNLAGALQIMSVPSMMFFYNGKRVVFQTGENQSEDRIVGFLPNIDEVIDNLVTQLKKTK